MAIEYLLVTYPEQRAVLADGNRVGFTNHEYLITLEGSGYAPPNKDVPLSGTSLVKPMVISFSPIAPAGGGAPPFPPAAAPAPAPRPAGKKKKNA
jgi:hypothetical protein